MALFCVEPSTPWRRAPTCRSYSQCAPDPSPPFAAPTSDVLPVSHSSQSCMCECAEEAASGATAARFENVQGSSNGIDCFNLSQHRLGKLWFRKVEARGMAK
eukprot:scaffold67228_cov15-Tisochrysis_lutea.AAC.2